MGKFQIFTKMIHQSRKMEFPYLLYSDLIVWYTICYWLRKEESIQKFTTLFSRPHRRECEHCQSLNDIVNITGDCETCPEGSFPNGERTACFDCKSDEIIDFYGSCKRCPEGLIPNENRRFCIACPKSLIANDGMCKTCPDPEKE